MTRLQQLIAEAQRLEASTRAKAAAEPHNLLAKATHASIRAQLDELKRQLAEEEAAIAKTPALKMDNRAILSFE